MEMKYELANRYADKMHTAPDALKWERMRETFYVDHGPRKWEVWFRCSHVDIEVRESGYAYTAKVDYTDDVEESLHIFRDEEFRINKQLDARLESRKP
jgi:hypothetical protein